MGPAVCRRMPQTMPESCRKPARGRRRTRQVILFVVACVTFCGVSAFAFRVGCVASLGLTFGSFFAGAFRADLVQPASHSAGRQRGPAEKRKRTEDVSHRRSAVCLPGSPAASSALWGNVEWKLKNLMDQPAIQEKALTRLSLAST